jgi:UDP-N-acetyl-D-mannosaminuronic acid dehydrogenase
MHDFEKICVIGLGYIGLPTAAVLASRRLNVLGVDIQQQVVDTINQGKIHIVEPRLDMLVHSTITEGYLRASTTPEGADAYIIAVPTPFKIERGEIRTPDLKYIEEACKSIAPCLEPGNLVILESTSPVGTTEQVSEWLQALRPDLRMPLPGEKPGDIYIAHCPERVLPGYVVRELVDNDRVIGGITPACSEKAVQLYKIFVEGQCITTNARTAEMTKLTENSFRDVNIAFANELSMICDKQDIDVWELLKLANHHPRVNILNPGPGVGGHCIAVDPWFIISQSPEEARLIQTARNVNDHKPKWVLEKVYRTLDSILATTPEADETEMQLSIFGLTFKADIDDMRESPALSIAVDISRKFKGVLKIVEPNIRALPPSLSNSATLTDIQTALLSPLCLVLVDHYQFKEAFTKYEGIVIDTRGIL